MSPHPLDAHAATSHIAFVIDLTYTAPLDVIDRLLEAHHQHLNTGFMTGLCLAAGPKVPRTGGIILTEGDRDDVERFIAADPFIQAEAATVKLTQFVPRRQAPIPTPASTPDPR